MTKYYTIHPRRVWKKFKEQGYIIGNKEHSMFPEEYQWMIGEMAKRLPNYQGEYPVWLWTKIHPFYTYENSMVSRKKFVLLTIELDDKDVLLSDFDAWHIPLNNWTFSDDFVHSNDRKTDRSDWDKIFDFDWLKKHFHEDESKELHLQGTTGRIPIDKVVAVKHFSSKKHKY